MGNLVNYITAMHQSTERSYIDRMIDDKVNCMLKAKEYEFDYWDGNRRYGYGGYKYIAGRWKPVAEILIKKYNLSNNSSILDVGCGKGFLLYEIRLLLPRIKISGFDISKHGLAQAKEEIKKLKQMNEKLNIQLANSLKSKIQYFFFKTFLCHLFPHGASYLE